MEAPPKLRHEFVGMMFAVTIGEVGIQAASLIRDGSLSTNIPALTHLMLATVMIAASWVGWSVSMAARGDVRDLFDWNFVVLLIDVLLVVMYFILVRTIDFSGSSSEARIDPESRVALIVVIIFCTYLVWDLITKIIMHASMLRNDLSGWWRTMGVRVLPTVACVVVAWWVFAQVRDADRAHYITADVALMALVLLFRALKDLASALFSSDQQVKRLRPRVAAWGWTVTWLLLILGGTIVTRYALPIGYQ